MKDIKTAFLFAAPWVTFQLFSQRLASPLGSKQEDGRRERGRGAGRGKGGKEGGLKGRKRRKELGRGRRGGRGEREDRKGERTGRREKVGGRRERVDIIHTNTCQAMPLSKSRLVGGRRWEVGGGVFPSLRHPSTLRWSETTVCSKCIKDPIPAGEAPWGPWLISCRRAG